MTSKEALNEICKECNKTSDCDKKYGACPNFNKVWDDLEDYEELLKIMGTPIEKIMKKLKFFEILIKHIKFVEYGVFDDKIGIYLPVNYRKELKEYQDND